MSICSSQSPNPNSKFFHFYFIFYFWEQPPFMKTKPAHRINFSEFCFGVSVNFRTFRVKVRHGQSTRFDFCATWEHPISEWETFPTLEKTTFWAWKLVIFHEFAICHKQNTVLKTESPAVKIGHSQLKSTTFFVILGSYKT